MLNYMRIAAIIVNEMRIKNMINKLVADHVIRVSGVPDSQKDEFLSNVLFNDDYPHPEISSLKNEVVKCLRNEIMSPIELCHSTSDFAEAINDTLNTEVNRLLNNEGAFLPQNVCSAIADLDAATASFLGESRVTPYSGHIVERPDYGLGRASVPRGD